MRKLLPHGSITTIALTSGICASIGLLGGIGLQSVQKQLFAVVPLVVALPAMNAMASDYATVVASHAGDPNDRVTRRRKLFLILMGSMPLSIVGVIGMSLFIAVLQGYTLDRQFMYRFSAFVAVALAVVMITTYLMAIFLSQTFKKSKINSDDVLITITNAFSSVIMLGCISLAAWLIF